MKLNPKKMKITKPAPAHFNQDLRCAWPGNTMEDFAPVPNIIPLEQVADLLGDASDPLSTLYVVLPLFAGLPHFLIPSLKWHCFDPGRRIKVPALPFKFRHHAVNGCRPRILPISRGLDQWLRPFYHTTDSIFVDLPLHQQAANLMASARVWRSEKLRMTYLAHRKSLLPTLASDSAYFFRSEFSALEQRPADPFDRSLAEHFFSLGPEDLGIADWPDRVAYALQQRYPSNSQP